MSKNLIAANVLLLIVAGLLGWQLQVSIKRFNNENVISKIQPVRNAKSLTLDQGLAAPKPVRQYSAGEFDVIAAQNLFSETRAREEKAAEAPAIPESPPLDIKPVLVGVTISGSQRQALIIDPSNASAGRKTQRRKLGDNFRGYTITDIGDNSLVLQNGNRREVIPLFDGGKHPGGGGKTAILATRVIAFGPGGGAGGGGISVAGAVPAGASPARVAGTAQPGSSVTTVVGPAQAAAMQSGQSSTARTPQQQQTTRQTPGASGASQGWNERTDDQGRRVIRTPFGDIVRPDKPNNP